jgi:hypothetical protein
MFDPNRLPFDKLSSEDVKEGPMGDDTIGWDLAQSDLTENFGLFRIVHGAFHNRIEGMCQLKVSPRKHARSHLYYQKRNALRRRPRVQESEKKRQSCQVTIREGSPIVT